MPEQLISDSQGAVVLLIKIGVSIFLFIYVIFAAVIIKQVRMMTETLEMGFAVQIKFVVLVHFVFSLAVLVLAIVAI